MSDYRHNGGPPLAEESPFGPNGWIAIARDIRFHSLVGFGKPVPPCDESKGSYSRGEAWMDLMMECRFKDGVVNNNGRTMNLRRGQLLGANLWLAQRWNWTPKTVRVWLEKLDDEGMISFKNDETIPGPSEISTGSKQGRSKGRLANVITICNFNIFQMAHKKEGQVEGQDKGRLRAGWGQVEGDIYKEEQRNNVTKDSGGGGARDAKMPADACREGEDEVAPGLYVNCDTVRHRDFVLSISSIAMQLALANIGLSRNQATDVARESSIAHAMQWSAEISAGKAVRAVVPAHPANFIRGAVISQHNRQQAQKNAKPTPWRGGRPAPQQHGTRRTSGAEFLEAAQRIEAGDDPIEADFRVIDQ